MAWESARLARHLGNAVLVRPGDRFERLGTDRFTLRSSRREDYEELYALAKDDKSPKRVVHMWTLGDSEDTEQALDLGFNALLMLVQALGERSLDACRIDVVSDGLHDVYGIEKTIPAKTVVLGPCKVIPQEYPMFRTSCIDVVLDAGIECVAARLAEALLAVGSEDVVALRGSHRWVQGWEQVPIDGGAKSRLRHGGVYLITGGLGGIALAMAEHLASTWQARLVLLARSAPEHKLEKLRRLQEAGAEVLLVLGDVSKEDDVRSALRAADERFGAVHGVFHTAGVPAVGMMQWKTQESVSHVFAPKIHGTLALDAALAGRALDCLVLFSSVTSATGGGPGQADYCAANAFLDAWARTAPPQYGAVSVSWGEWQWDAWQDGLKGFPEEARALMIANRRAYGIHFGEGIDALTRVLARRMPHVFVVPQQLPAMVELSRRASAANNLAELQALRNAHPLHARPALSTSYVEPHDGVGASIASIWRQMLGIEPIGADDNFFELGGNSLLGLSLIARMRKELGLDRLPAHILYQAPTVNALATYVENGNEQPRPDVDDDVRNRRMALRRMRNARSIAE